MNLVTPEWLVFAKVFLRHPWDVSSIFRTRTAVAKRLADRIREWRPQVIVEYGPATGSVSRAILAGGKLAASSSLLLIEKTPEFVEYLRRTLHDPRVSIFHRSATDVLKVLAECGLGKADCIFSGIPLTLIPVDSADAILRNTREALNEDGLFVQYAFRRNNMEVLLRRHFQNVRSRTEIFNIPPLMVFEARKN
ncbi:hypothetical protein EXS65_02755 [Candidatus Peribacteria bacterium]|nr:hypothetical protein [Candidatus Peribacteria bacterium]